MRKFSLVLLLLIVSLLVTGCKNQISKDEEIARRLGVNENDYPPVSEFPVGYYLATLTQGMPISEVHEKVIGYDKVLHFDTPNFHSEIFFYYGTSDSALKFQTIYDNNDQLTMVITEDYNSQTIILTDFQDGLIGSQQYNSLLNLAVDICRAKD